MVSINTSTSFTGTKKPAESSSDTDMTGLENIFASMLNVIDEETKSLNGLQEHAKAGGVVGLLEKIRKELNLNLDSDAIENLKEINPEVLSSNVLQIYKTYKTLIDQAIEIADESTISFDMEKIPSGKLRQETLPSLDAKEVTFGKEIQSEQYKKLLPLSEVEDLNVSMEEFSEQEMRRIKASMKQEQISTAHLETIDNNKISVLRNGPASPLAQPSNQTKLKLNSLKDKIVSPIDQNNLESKLTNQTTDSPKVESIIDVTQTSSKNATSRMNLAEQNLQSNQKAEETQLKLLEKNWGNDLAKIIEKAILSGKEKIEIHLDPQKLGKMHLSLSVVNNQTSIFISTETAAASLILTSAEERLAQMFENSGYKLSNFQANSNGKNNSNRNRSDTQHVKQIHDKKTDNELAPFNKKENQALYTVDGRKIINIIA